MNVEYFQLCRKVDSKFAEIQQKHAHNMHCAEGCAQCCIADLTISKVEQENIRAFLMAHPTIVQELKQQEASHELTNPNSCLFLNRQKLCTIYEVRPIICRSHGVPTFRRDDNQQGVKAVCKLNFTGDNLSSTASTDFINLDMLNTILAMINNSYYPNEGNQRFSLSPATIIESKVAYYI